MVNEIFTTIGILMLLELLLINAYTKNFLGSYFLTRISNDARVMVQVFTNYGFYFRAGKIDEKKITYKTAGKEKATLSTQKAKYHRSMSVLWVLVEEGSDRVITPAFEGKPGAKPVEYDNYLRRALTKPQIDNLQDKFLKYGIIAIGGVLLFLTWKVMGIETALNATQTISGGNVQ